MIVDKFATHTCISRQNLCLIITTQFYNRLQEIAFCVVWTFLFFNDFTRHPLLATRHPLLATRHPPLTTRHPSPSETSYHTFWCISTIIPFFVHVFSPLNFQLSCSLTLCAITFRKRPPPISNHLSKTLKISRSKPDNENL